MPKPVIEIENLGKRYRMRHRRNQDDGMRHAIEGAMRAPLQWLRNRRRGDSIGTDFWALRNVSLQMNRGEVVGIVGKNGSGKSTMLKLLSRITVPTEGKISIRGRVASLIEVGTGFHPELTGRENIFLNGAILGMSRTEIVRKFDEIVDFSEISEFLDTPVKRYSSGMYVRLAFAVAAHLEPEVLIVDEVLAVGDTAFQNKCLGKMSNFAQSGRTVLFVSHNLEAVRTLCRRSVWLQDGHVLHDGDTDEIVSAYYDSTFNHNAFSFSNPAYAFAVTNVLLKNERGEVSNQFRPGQELNIQIDYDSKKRLEQPYVVLAIQSTKGTCFTANMLLDGHRPEALTGNGKVVCHFRFLPLYPQHYSVKMSIRAKNGSDWIIEYQEVAHFSVVGDLTDYGYKGEFLSRASSSSPMVVPYEWRLPDGEVAAVSLTRPSTERDSHMNGNHIVNCLLKNPAGR